MPNSKVFKAIEKAETLEELRDVFDNEYKSATPEEQKEVSFLLFSRVTHLWLLLLEHRVADLENKLKEDVGA